MSRSLDGSSVEFGPTQVSRRAARGMVLLAVRSIVIQLVTFAGTVVLARALDPQDFGVFAVLQFALTFFQLFGDVGMGAALVQRKETPSGRALASLFTLQTLLAVAITALIWAAAPAVTLVWANLPANSYVLLRAMSLSFLITAVRVVPSILLERSLRFGAIALAEVAQVVAFYFVACACALGGLRAWTWPAGLLAQAVTGTAVVFIAHPWRPRLALDGDTLRSLVQFGLPFQFKNLIGFANGAVTPLYAGSVLGASAVGLIGWGQQLAYLPLKLVEVVGRVSFPLFSRIQHDRRSLARALQRMLQLCAVGVFFSSALFLTAGPNVTTVVFAEKWLAGLVALYAFAAVLVVGFVSPVVGALLDAVGRPGVIARLAAAWTALNWIVVPLATARWGFEGFIYGYCVHVLVGNVALLLLLPGIVPEVTIVRPLLAPFLGGIAVAAVGWFVLRPLATTPFRLGVGVGLAAAIHLVIVAIGDPDSVADVRRLLGRGSTS